MASKKTRKRRVYSVTEELLAKSREAALSAVHIFNSPLIRFKTEIFIVLMNIAWTYLLHAYYRKARVEYRYFTQRGQRKQFDKTKHGAHKHWELERCLDCNESPIDKNTADNLRFLIGVRHEIEHQMTTRLDSILSAKFQACCLNFNDDIKRLFGDRYGIDKHLAFSLQFASISREQASQLDRDANMPGHIEAFVKGFEGQLSKDDFNNPKFAYRVLFVAKTVNHPGQADEVIQFVKADSPLAQDINASYTVIKETERQKHLPSTIVAQMRKEGFAGFSVYDHTTLWQRLGAKDPKLGFGIQVQSMWYWYDSWLDEVRTHCESSSARYRATKKSRKS